MDHTQGKLYEIIKQLRSIFEKDTIQFMQFKEREHKKIFLQFSCDFQLVWPGET